jgi:hypothetical protein
VYYCRAPSTARKILYGNRGETYQAYRAGQEDQLGELGPVLNAVMWWNTSYIDLAVTMLRAHGYPVRDEDAARCRRRDTRTPTCSAATLPKARRRPAGAARPRRPGNLMRAKDIEPGREYGRAQVGYTPEKVTVTSATAQRVSYSPVRRPGVVGAQALVVLVVNSSGVVARRWGR